MKKNLLYIVVLVILLGVAGWLLSGENGSSTLEGQENYAFTVSDTAALSKIVISTKKPSSATLEERNGAWLLEGEHPVRSEAINTLLGTLASMELKNFVSQRMQDKVIRDLMARGKKVELYKEGRLFKTIYVGEPTPDQLGTYMMLADGDAPYAVHIPGFNGFLNTRFIDQPHLWRRRDLVRMNPRNIKEVKMIFPDSLQASYRLRVFSPDSIYLIRASDEKAFTDVSPTKAQLFLAAFKNLRYEGAIIPSDPIYDRRDSLLAGSPVFRFTVKDIDGKTTTVSGYKIKAEAQTIDPEDPSTFHDPDRLHGFINEQRMVLLQYYALRNVLLPLDHFREEAQ